MRISTYKTVEKHFTINTLLAEIKKAGFKGIATQSQYRGQAYPVIVLRDFSQSERPEDWRADIFLGGAPIEVKPNGRLFSLLNKEVFVTAKEECIAVWK
jgi:hypothetical protein